MLRMLDKKARRIKMLKERAKAYYLAYTDVIDGASCGVELAEYMSSTASDNKRKFNAIAAEIRKLDPTFPKDDL